jgi:hypothetical protein
MRLRARLAGGGGETHKIITPEVCDLGALRALLASRLLPAGAPPAAVRLSLNGTDELAPGVNGATLQAAGIAPGDLVYVLPVVEGGGGAAAAGAARAAAAPALAQLTWQAPPGARGAPWAASAGPRFGAAAAAPAPTPAPALPLTAEQRRAACLRAAEARGGGGAITASGAAASAGASAPSATAAGTDADADADVMDSTDAEAAPPPAPPLQLGVPGARTSRPFAPLARAFSHAHAQARAHRALTQP